MKNFDKILNKSISYVLNGKEIIVPIMDIIESEGIDLTKEEWDDIESLKYDLIDIAYDYWINNIEMHIV